MSQWLDPHDNTHDSNDIAAVLPEEQIGRKCAIEVMLNGFFLFAKL